MRRRKNRKQTVVCVTVEHVVDPSSHPDLTRVIIHVATRGPGQVNTNISCVWHLNKQMPSFFWGESPFPVMPPSSCSLMRASIRITLNYAVSFISMRPLYWHGRVSVGMSKQLDFSVRTVVRAYVRATGCWQQLP